jgi:solute carrier family 15 oligopeptide transporter 1
LIIRFHIHPPAAHILSVIGLLPCRFCGANRVRYPHMLDAANKKYGREFINDVKSALGVMWLFLPLPIFWTLFDQSGSRWTVQATQMQTFSMGDLGEFRPDQMQAANSLLILLFIPLFERGV